MTVGEPSGLTRGVLVALPGELVHRLAHQLSGVAGTYVAAFQVLERYYPHRLHSVTEEDEKDVSPCHDDAMYVPEPATVGLSYSIDQLHDVGTSPQELNLS